jgi:hypothetical protein
MKEKYNTVSSLIKDSPMKPNDNFLYFFKTTKPLDKKAPRIMVPKKIFSERLHLKSSPDLKRNLQITISAEDMDAPKEIF